MAKVLEGIKVFDLTVAAAGPWTTKLLGALGADVIKVEPPGGDLAAVYEPLINKTGAVYICSNHNKRNIILDLKSPSDLALAYRLVKACDVFVQNIRPGAADKLGFSFEKLSALNPRLIYVSLNAYGTKGPMAMETGIDTTVQAFSGWCSVTGASDGRPEMYRSLTHLDITTAAETVQAILLALIARRRSGRGLRIDVSMIHAALALQRTRLAEYFATSVQPSLMGSATPSDVPHRAFLCQDRRYLAVGVVKETQWPGFCRAVGLSELIDNECFRSNARRVENRAELVTLLKERFSTKPSAWWSLRLSHENVPNAKFWDFDTIRMHPQVTANHFMFELETPKWGPLWAAALPWKFGLTPAGPIKAGGNPGEHTSEVRAELQEDRHL